MNKYFLTAGILCFLLGMVHSILGEYLIFQHKRNKGSWVPSKGSLELREGHLRIIWATWHLASVFGWCIGAILILISFQSNDLSSRVTHFILQSMTWAILLGSFLVLFGTKGRHPGWIVLLIIGILLIIGNR